MSGGFVERRLDISTKEHIFSVEVILSFCSFVLLSHKMSLCYCMGGFQFKKTAFSFYLTGQKWVNRSIQSIFLYIYTVYALLFYIFSAYMKAENHSPHVGSCFSFKRRKNVFFPAKFRLENRVPALFGCFFRSKIR